MAGEGTKYTKKKTLEACRKLLANYNSSVQDTPACVPAKLHPERDKAYLPDGSLVPVTATGQITGDYCIVCRTNTGFIAFGHEIPVIRSDGANTIAYILERFENKLWIREVGSEIRVQVPEVLPVGITQDEYAGGFSSDGNMLFVAGSDVQDDGANVIIYWYIFKNFRITSEDAFSYDIPSSTSGSVNLNDKFREKILPQFSPPGPGELETEGLTGPERSKYIFRFWPSSEINEDPISNQEIIDFINYLIEYFELTEEDVELLFPPLFWVLVFRQGESNRFFPSTHIEYSSLLTPPIYDPTAFGRGMFVENEYTGFRNSEWSYDPNCLPVFMEVNFAFNNDRDGNPVLDIIASYQTTTVFKNDSANFETYFRHKNNLGPPLNENPEQVVSDEGYYTRSDSESWSYTYPSNYAYIEPGRGAGNQGFLPFEYTITDPVDGVHQHNFILTSGGTRMITTGEIQSGATFYKPVLWFDEYAPPEGLGREAAEGIAFGAVDGVNYGLGVFYAVNQFFAGNPYVQVYYPPDIGEYIFERYDGTTEINPNGIYYPVPPEPFMTYYPYYREPSFGTYHCLEDVYVWGTINPFANVYQFGRGVMAITNANSDSPEYRYIDRPPAAPNDYDHLDTSYLGVNGTRALLAKEDHFNAYAYSQEYIATSNQIVGLDRPDTFTDIIFVDKGTWPYTVDGLKAVNSNDFVQYTTATGEDLSVDEVVQNINVQINPTVVTIGKAKSGSKPAGGTVLDYVIKGSTYED